MADVTALLAKLREEEPPAVPYDPALMAKKIPAYSAGPADSGSATGSGSAAGSATATEAEADTT
jgi:hypothetical protein